MNNFNIDTVELESGAHNSPESGFCAMELVAYMAGEKHSDRPACTDPVLASFVRRLNDKMDDTNRQRLKPFLPRLMGTNDGKSLQRAKILAHAALTVFAPFALDAAMLPEWAEKMRALPLGEWEANRKVAREASNAAAYAAAYANYAAAATAANAANAANAAADAANAAAAAAAAYAAAAYAAANAYAAYAAANAYAADAYAADAAAYAAANAYAAAYAARTKLWDQALAVLDQALST